MKPITHFFLTCFSVCCLMVAGGCESNEAETTNGQNDEQIDTTDPVHTIGPEVWHCGKDSIVPIDTALTWIKEGWQQEYESLNLETNNNGEIVKYGGFDSFHVEALLRQCDDCPYISVAFGLSSSDTRVPHAIMMNVDSDCNLITEGDTAALISTVNKHPEGPHTGYVESSIAADYMNNWKDSYTFPEGFQTVYSYTYNRTSVLSAMDACGPICSDGSTTLRATYAVHPDMFNGGDSPDSLLMDIVFTCDCSEGDSMRFSRDFVDIANPCPQICPNQ